MLNFIIPSANIWSLNASLFLVNINLFNVISKYDYYYGILDSFYTILIYMYLQWPVFHCFTSRSH